MRDRRWEPIVLVACVIVLLAMHTHTYAQTWRSDLALWGNAVQMTPQKPRPWINYGGALAHHGFYGDARAAWAQAARVANYHWILPWDRAAAKAIAADNLAALDRFLTPQ